ncbi:MAG: HAD hydrolase family protein [Pyrinomonadaceae bacterium]|nr:HAD hydrolase family protein [Pyrinomonadaceae bacterium]
MSDDFCERASKIELLLMDCDGVLTDGLLYYSPVGEEIKVFNVRDGFGLVKWKTVGKKWGIITGRSSECLAIRSRELSADYLVQGSPDKLHDVRVIANDLGLGLEQIAFVGDDEPDVEAMTNVGLAVAVADAEPIVLTAAHFVTRRNGGSGAVRETIDKILNCR